MASAPQQCNAKELVGYAVVFGVAAASLIPAAVGTDTIGPAQYEVGTHQVAIASENRSWVKGTPPQLIPAAAGPVVIVLPIHAAPEQLQSGFALLTGPTPQTASAVILYTETAAPQAVDLLDGRASVWGPQPAPAAAPADVRPPITRVAAPEQVDSGYAKLSRYVYPSIFGTDVVGPARYEVGTHAAAYAQNNGYAIKFGRYVVPAIVGTDVRIGRTSTAAPPQIESGYAKLWHQTPPDLIAVFKFFEVEQESTWQPSPGVWGFTPPTVVGTDRPPPHTVRAAPEQIESGYTWRARFVYPFVAGSDPKIGQTRAAAPQQVESGYALVYGPQPVTASVVVQKTRTSAPEQINSGDAWVWGTAQAATRDDPLLRAIFAAPEHVNTGAAHVWGLFQPYVFGTDVAVGTTWIAAPEQIESGDAWMWRWDEIPTPPSGLSIVGRRGTGTVLRVSGIGSETQAIRGTGSEVQAIRGTGESGDG